MDKLEDEEVIKPDWHDEIDKAGSR